ncbi:MAG: FAA hydrolase family protein [Lysobacterales bacterium]|nr:MAG: FAA hydrolase family protein [Xanthomonadales bacterium]
MKLVICEKKDSSTPERFLAGVVAGEVFGDLSATYGDRNVANARLDGMPADMTRFLEAGEPALEMAQAALEHASRILDGTSIELAMTADGMRVAYRREELTLLPAVPRPGKIIHTAINFSSHKQEVATKFKATEWKAHGWGSFHYEHPTGFLQAPSATVGADATVIIPRFTEQLDYEIEIATIIGRRAKDVSEEQALDYVAGFCVFNDVSARDIQAREHANKVIMLGKSFDTSCPLGPWLTTRDEIPDPQNLKMQLRLNGELRQDSNTSQMIYKIAELVSWWSQITLEPGDVITSGSPAGVIAGRENPVWLAPGDRIEAMIEGLGTLSNIIAAPAR